MYSIGQLAALTGLPVKTIRFYSDEGILPPAGRSENGHRRYTGAELARLQLARSLRELDVDLPSIRRVLEGHEDLAEILRAHVATVEARIRGLQRQRAVLSAARGRSTGVWPLASRTPKSSRAQWMSVRSTSASGVISTPSRAGASDFSGAKTPSTKTRRRRSIDS